MRKIIIPKNKIKDTIKLLTSKNSYFIVEDNIIYEDKWASFILSCFKRKTWGLFYTLAMCNIIEKDSKNAVVEVIYINSAKYLIGINPYYYPSKKIEKNIMEYILKGIEGSKELKEMGG